MKLNSLRYPDARYIENVSFNLGSVKDRPALSVKDALKEKIEKVLLLKNNKY